MTRSAAVQVELSDPSLAEDLAGSLRALRGRGPEERSEAFRVEILVRVVPDDAPSSEPERGGSRLSGREREILQLIADGLTNREIAGQLGISIETVKAHVASLRRKLGANSRVTAVAIGFRSVLVH